MKTKVRLITIVLVGILVGVVAVRIQQSFTPLSARLVSNDDATRVSALKVFSVKSEDAREKIVDEIVSVCSSSPNPRQLQLALYTLRKSGFSSPKVINPMIDALSNDDAKVREEATAGLLEMGEAAFPLLVDSLGQLASSRDHVIALLAKSSPKVIPVLAAAIANPEKLVKSRGAAIVFIQMAPGDTLTAAREALPMLTEAVKSSDTTFSLNAAFAIHTIDPVSRAPAAVFLRSIQMENWDNWEVRGWDSVRALSEIPAASAQSVPVLSRLTAAAQDGFVKDKRYRRPVLAGALERLSPRSSKVSDLTWDLKNRDASIRYRAVLKIGSDPKSYPSMVGPLIGVIDDRVQAVGARAVWALMQIGLQNTTSLGTIAYPKYVARLENIDNKVVEGFQAMAGPSLGALNGAALPAVIDAVKIGELRLETANIVLTGSSDVNYLTALMLHNQHSEVRLMAAIALARLAPKTPGLAQELEKGSKRLGKVGEDVSRALKAVQNSGGKK